MVSYSGIMVSYNGNRWWMWIVVLGFGCQRYVVYGAGCWWVVVVVSGGK